MTNWRAVGVGFLVEFVLGVVAFALPGIGHFVVSLVGGFVAGYMASTTIASGLWHGLLAGSLGGFLLALPAGVLVSVLSYNVGFAGELGSLFTGTSAVVLVLLVAVILGANSALGGAIGALVNANERDSRSHSTSR